MSEGKGLARTGEQDLLRPGAPPKPKWEGGTPLGGDEAERRMKATLIDRDEFHKLLNRLGDVEARVEKLALDYAAVMRDIALARQTMSGAVEVHGQLQEVQSSFAKVYDWTKQQLAVIRERIEPLEKSGKGPRIGEVDAIYSAIHKAIGSAVTELRLEFASADLAVRSTAYEAGGSAKVASSMSGLSILISIVAIAVAVGAAVMVAAK